MKRGVAAGVNEPGPHPERAASTARRRPGIRRLLAWLALLLAAAIVAGSGFAWLLAQRADDDLEASQRRALRGAMETLQAVSPGRSEFDPRFIPMIERMSGLKDLRFESEPPGAGRTVQSLIDDNGRIVGWVSWEAEQPATTVLRRLLPFGALIAAGLLGFAGLAMWQLNRLGRMLTRSEQTVQRLAHADPITGLPNQHHLFETMDGALAGRKGGEVVAFALLDFGGLDDIRDALGGDEDGLLEEIGTRLRNAVPKRTTVGRLRGDLFGLVIPASNAEEAIAIAGNAREEGSRALWLNQVVQISANAGLAIAPRDGATRYELRHRAELALRSARRRGRGLLVVFANAMEAQFEERAFIKQELAHALATRAFDVHYQPIVRADNAAIVGVEALVRWEHPIRGLIPSALFVQVAEDAGFMEELGEFVLRRALTDAARWPNLYVAVNLSPVQVRDGRFVALVSAVLTETMIAPSRLALEITEGVLIDDPATAKARLEDLRALGVKLALDDFGAGYSSLGYLQRLPFDTLKIDRQFVAALDVSANAGVVIQAIVALGRALGMRVLVEGVETEAQRVLVRLAGCDEIQGFLFAEPMPRENIDRLVAGEVPLGAKPDMRPAS